MKFRYAHFRHTDYLKKISANKMAGLWLVKHDSVEKLKQKATFEQLCDFVDKNHGIPLNMLKGIYGSPLPKNYETLGVLRKKDTPSRGSLLSEINWSLLAVREYRWKIQLFVEYRQQYENAFLIGDYSTAESIISKIEKEVCYSLWTLENRMLLLEFSKSPEEHKAFISDINREAKGFFIPTLVHYLSNRSEKHLSVSRYDLDLKSALNKLKGDKHEGDREFYFIKLNKYLNKKYSSLQSVMTYDCYHSVIDRYITLVEILKISMATSNKKSENYKELKSKLLYLSDKISDPRTNSIKNLVFMDLSEKDKFDLNVLDLFTSGQYEACIEKVSSLLLSNAQIIEYYIIYVKSLIYNKKTFVQIGASDSIQNRIALYMYDYVNRSVDPHDAFINLSRLMHNLHSFTIADGISWFLNNEYGSEPIMQKYSYLALSPSNPEIAEFFSEDLKKKEYIELLKKEYPNSIAVSRTALQLLIINEDEINSLNLPDIIKNIEIAKISTKKNNYIAAKKNWQEVLDKADNIIPLKEIAIRGMYNIYVDEGSLDEAINLYVKTYFEDESILYAIDTKKIHKEIRAKKFRNVTPSLNLPLFYTFSSKEETDQHIAYEIFNASLGIEMPSELNVSLNDVELDKWIVYLRETCTVEIFKHSIYIEGSKEGWSERIKICQKLLLLDKPNEDRYKKEISEITDSLIIQQGLQNMDESKIYVNENGLINSELKEFEGLYSRFKTISNIYVKSKKNLLIFNRKKGVRFASVDDISSAITNNNNDQYSSDPLRDTFDDIFDVITRKFLFSKFGISAYLSTRIRHGVLLGEIRPVFEKYNLISQRDNSSDTYRDIEYWSSNTHYVGTATLIGIQKALKSFSKSIDSIINGLLRDSLQIKTEDENLEGWFDYYFNEAETALYAIRCTKTSNFEEFVKMVLDILWTRTDENLDRIRSEITNIVKSKFNEAIAKLTRELQAINLPTSSTIYSNISTCFTEIHNVLDRVATWFNRSGRQTSDFSLDKLINTVIENISHSYPKKRLVLKEFEFVDVMIKGEFYMHFADLFRIFLDNALKHSDEIVDAIPVEISINRVDNYLDIEVLNHYSKNGSIISSNRNTNTTFDLKKLSTEGKSGFPKADKIIRSDFNNPENSYSFAQVEGDVFSVTVRLDAQKLII